MPLSEQEQRLLEEMERSLYHNDADYVAGAGGRRGRPTYSRIGVGILIGVVGVAIMITGVGVQLPVLGVFGFVVMFVGVLLALTPPRSATRRASATDDSSQPGGAKADGPGSKAGGGSFFSNLENRWDNRSDEHEE